MSGKPKFFHQPQSLTIKFWYSWVTDVNCSCLEPGELGLVRFLNATSEATKMQQRAWMELPFAHEESGITSMKPSFAFCNPFEIIQKIPMDAHGLQLQWMRIVAEPIRTRFRHLRSQIPWCTRMLQPFHAVQGMCTCNTVLAARVDDLSWKLLLFF